MSDKTVPNPVPDPMEDKSSGGLEAVTPDLPYCPGEAAESDWETVDFPDQIPLQDNSSGDAFPGVAEPGIESTVLPPSNSKESATSTDELIQLIQDLNHCNDALLNRISNLEEALERSQAALQVEVERNQSLGSHASGAAPQQVAQLLSELDVANDGLRRTTMHNEALQAELDVNQQRVAQLERECTLLQQRFNEKTVALQQAENTCHDLKSRLHRQQRYTLQFKAALEKCLNMPASHSAAGTPVDGLPLTPPDPVAQPVSIPRSQQIQPWSAGDQAHPQDLSLTDLLRGLKVAGHGPSRSTPVANPQPPAPSVEKASDPEAEAILWQDLERVTEPQPWQPVPNQPSSPVAPPPAPAFSEPAADQPTFTEPSPWGAPIQRSTADEIAAPEGFTTLPPESSSAPGEAAASPGAPPPGPLVADMPRSRRQPQTLPDYLPQAVTPGNPAPAPLVYPLRAQKKRKSLSAVELPSFGRPPQRR
jgi:hypothetical protein